MDTLRSYSKKSLSKTSVTFMVVDEGGSALSEWDSRIQFDESSVLPSAFSGPMITLPINPTDIVRSQPIRTEITPSVTFDNDYNPTGIVQSWGASIPKWTIRGHTGYRIRAVDSVSADNGTDDLSFIDGYLTYVALYRFFEGYCKTNILRLQDTPPQQSYQMVFIAWSERFQDWWYVEPTKIPDKIRTNEKPLYYFYDIELVGVKPFNNVAKVTDDVSLIVSDAGLRLNKVSVSLGNQYTSLNGFDMGTVPNYIRSSYNDILDNVNEIITQNMLFKSLQQGVLIAKSVLQTIDIAITDIKGIVKTVLSPLFELVNIYKQIKCTFLTLIALPLDLYTSAYDSIKQLVASLKASGCGTTLSSNSTQIGFASLRQ